MPDNNELHIAAVGGDLEQVQFHVRNFDINAKGEDGGTALYWSARNGHAEVVKLLLTFNADVNIPDVSLSKRKSVHLICISPIPYLHVMPLFLHLSAYIIITLSLSPLGSDHLLHAIFNITSCRRFIN